MAATFCVATQTASQRWRSLTRISSTFTHRTTGSCRTGYMVGVGVATLVLVYRATPAYTVTATSEATPMATQSILSVRAGPVVPVCTLVVGQVVWVFTSWLLPVHCSTDLSLSMGNMPLWLPMCPAAAQGEVRGVRCCWRCWETSAALETSALEVDMVKCLTHHRSMAGVGPVERYI